MQGGIDHEGNVNARLNQGWSQSNITKAQAQVSDLRRLLVRADVSQLSFTEGHSMLQLEHDYQGRDFSANIKVLNPSAADLSGIYVGNYLQSVSKTIAVGFESVVQRPAPGMSELSTSYLAKYTSRDKNWIATAQIQPPGIVQATYWQKLSEKLDVAADLQVVAAPTRRDAVATLGAKWDLRAATFRAQVDSTGKVSALLEQRFSPALAILFAGEIDHFKVRRSNPGNEHRILTWNRTRASLGLV